MKRFFAVVAFFLSFACLAVSGCSTRTPPDTKEIQATVKESDPFRSMLESFRYRENPRPTDDWTRFREGFPSANAYFSSPDVLARLHLSAPEREFLVNSVHLAPDEMNEVEATTMRTADAHYLDEAFLLRDAARYLEVPGLNAVDQAQRDFAWVMRNVYLHEEAAAWVPPAFVLRRGFGGALERALVFLALLRQSQIEGCLIVVPEAVPKQFLVAVLDAKTSSGAKSANLYLFDSRLGTALPDKTGKKIASLKDVQEDPALLTPSLISPEDAKKLEAWLVCPLYALSPRMLEMQKGLSAYEPITLYLNPLQLQKEIAGVTKVPIQVWNAAVPAGANSPQEKARRPDSPTRCLRMFLPKQDGGTDETNRHREFYRQHLPLGQAKVNYARINLRPDLMPNQEYVKLLSLTLDMLGKYEIEPRELFLRGLHEAALRREERLRPFVKDDNLVGLITDKEFRRELSDWTKKLRQASEEIILNQKTDPRALKNAQNQLQSLWFSDQFVNWMLNLDNEEQMTRELKKSTLTGILAVGVREPLDLDLGWLQASVYQEKAERAQAQMRRQEKPTKAIINKARDGWTKARAAWPSFYLEVVAMEPTLAQRLEIMRAWVAPLDLEKKIGLLEQMHRDLHLAFEAKVRLAECMEHAEGAQAAQTYRDAIRSEIEALEKRGQLPRAINEVRESVARLPAPVKIFVEEQLDLLARDWSARGSFFWLKRQLQSNQE